MKSLGINSEKDIIDSMNKETITNLIDKINQNLGYKQYVVMVRNGEIRLHQYKCSKVLARGCKNIYNYLEKNELNP